ncbi:DUF4395 domain-containing protein [Ornithinibacillus californiensis]|uniref:DUF4395 domain-containing protein n=1 Tax=Ornithinibacillus californiensis TaxID=161536 RepID=UPI00064DF6DB|nr:DUF4395 domain-containing protein [Ornithinibacillus californiensis]
MSIPKPLVQINQAFIAITVLLGLLIHPMIMVVPFVIGVYTLITKQNPIIQFSKSFLKKKPNQYKQEDKQQQLFNQWIATSCIGLSLIFFYVNMTILAYSFAIMVLAASTIALCGFCVGCFIRYRFMMWRYQRTKAEQ